MRGARRRGGRTPLCPARHIRCADATSAKPCGRDPSVASAQLCHGRRWQPQPQQQQQQQQRSVIATRRARARRVRAPLRLVVGTICAPAAATRTCSLPARADDPMHDSQPGRRAATRNAFAVTACPGVGRAAQGGSHCASALQRHHITVFYAPICSRQERLSRSWPCQPPEWCFPRVDTAPSHATGFACHRRASCTRSIIALA